jgi:radical SAM protein with 4Fe4S-binding SPASM domain
MDMDMYKRIIDEAKGVPQIQDVKLTGLGEPTLDRFLEERVKYAKDAGLYTQIYTNGIPLTPKRHDSLRESGLDSIVFSLNAVRSDQHDRIMGTKGKFGTVSSNIAHAITNRGDRHVEVHAVCNGDQFNQDDMVEFYKSFGDARQGGFGLCINEGNWAGENRTTRNFKPNEHCHRSTEHIYVMVDGRISACCFDPTGKLILGDLRKQSLREAYNAETYLAFREAHVANRADIYEICATCTRI